MDQGTNERKAFKRAIVCATCQAGVAMAIGSLGTVLSFVSQVEVAYAREALGSVGDLKGDSIRYLEDLRNRNSGRLKEINETLAKKIEQNQSQDLSKDVADLKSQQHEHLLRQDFLDRLILQFDRHFSGRDLRGFLTKTLTEMAKVDAVSARADTGLWKFLRYAAEAIDKEPEAREKVLSFLEEYMKQSVSNPVLPKDYLSMRNYSNGAKGESGSPASRESVGEIADRRIRGAEKNAEKPQTEPHSKASALVNDDSL